MLETSKFLATQAGQELNDLIVYLGDFAEQTIRALRNGLTFADNFNCKIIAAQMVHGVPTSIDTERKTPIGVLCTTGGQISWVLDDKGVLNVAHYSPGAYAQATTATNVVTTATDHKLDSGAYVDFVGYGPYQVTRLSATTFSVSKTLGTGTVLWRKAPTANVSLIVLFN